MHNSNFAFILPVRDTQCISKVAVLHENFLQFDGLRAVVFQLNLKLF